MSELLWQKPGVKVDDRIQRFLAGEDVVLDREFFLCDIDASRAHAEGLLRMTVPNAKGQAVPLSAFASTRWVKGAMQTVRYNGYPAMRLGGAAAPGFSSGDAMAGAINATVDSTIAAMRDGLSHDAVIIDHTTNLPALVAARAERLEHQGLRYLHAPVFMSPAAARAAQGIMMVAGPPGRFDAHLEQLQGLLIGCARDGPHHRLDRESCRMLPLFALERVMSERRCGIRIASPRLRV